MLNRIFLTLLFIVTLNLNCYGADSNDSMSVTTDQETEIDTNTETDGITNVSLKFLIGSFEPTANSGTLSGNEDGIAIGLGVSIDTPIWKYLAVDLEIFGSHIAYDTHLPLPLLPDYKDRMYIETVSYLFGLRLHTATKPIRFYGSAGTGLYQNAVYVYAQPWSTQRKLREHDPTAGLYIGGGVELIIKNFIISTDYRHFKHKGDFPQFDLFNVNLGGEFIGTSIGVLFN